MRLRSAMRALFTAFWVDRKSVQDLDTIIPILEISLGKEVTADVMAQSDGIEARDILRKNTKECFNSGSFGLPWIIATNSSGMRDTFWGFDRLGLVAEHLGFGGIVLPNERERRWLSL